MCGKTQYCNGSTVPNRFKQDNGDRSFISDYVKMGTTTDLISLIKKQFKHISIDGMWCCIL